ncbi:MAG: twin-arginine translocase TatA/TatE family subunit [Terriglobales bacterium]
MSFGELLFLAILALLIFGPRKLPEVARTVAKIIAELRKASNEFRYSLEEEIRTIESAEREQKLLQATPAGPIEGTIAREGKASPAPAAPTK